MTLYEVLQAFNPATVDQNLPANSFNETIRNCVAQNAALYRSDQPMFEAIYGNPFQGLNSYVLSWIINYLKERNDETFYRFTSKPECSWLRGITILTLISGGQGTEKYLFLNDTDVSTIMAEMTFFDGHTSYDSIIQEIEEAPNKDEIKKFLTCIEVLEEDIDPEHLMVPDLKDYDDTTLRFKGAQWFDEVQDLEITLVGVGGIGSHTALMLSRFHPYSMVLWDPDKVEAVNMAGQMYSIEDIDNFKTYASIRNIGKFSNYHTVVGHTRRFTKGCSCAAVMICGLDNMEARKECFETWLKEVRTTNSKEQYLFIDGRLAAEELQVFCIRGNCEYDIQQYQEKYLFSSAEAEAATCSYKQTAYMANMIAGVICNLVANFCANKQIPDFRSLPFLTTYNGYTMAFNTKD